MSVKDATVTVKYEDLRAMEEKIAGFERDQKLFEQQLQQATLQGAHAADQFRDAFLTAFAIVQYGLGHLDAMTFRGFPYEKLGKLADMLKTLPFLPPEIAELASDWRLLTREYKKWEDARAKGIEQQLLAEENARHSGGPGAGEAFDGVELPA